MNQFRQRSWNLVATFYWIQSDEICLYEEGKIAFQIQPEHDEAHNHECPLRDKETGPDQTVEMDWENFNSHRKQRWSKCAFIPHNNDSSENGMHVIMHCPHHNPISHWWYNLFYFGYVVRLVLGGIF